jgi:hypothetical protein
LARRHNGTSDFSTVPVANMSLFAVGFWLRVVALPSGGVFREVVTFAEAPGDTTQDKSARLYTTGTVTATVYTGSVVETGSLVSTVGTYEQWLLVMDGTNLTHYRDGTASTPVAAASSYTGYASPELVLARGATGTGFAQVDLARVALWDAPLSSGERGDFFAGVSPASIRTADLFDYWPLVADGAGVNGNTMSFTGGSFTDDPAGGAPAASAPAARRGRRRQRLDGFYIR